MPTHRLHFAVAASFAVLSCAHGGVPAAGSAAGTYTFRMYRPPCVAYVDCLNPPNPDSVVVLLDEPADPGGCFAAEGFAQRGCYRVDEGSPPEAAGWRRVGDGAVEVALGCGSDGARLILSGSSGKLTNAPWIAPAREWPVDVQRRADVTCTVPRSPEGPPR